MKLLAISGTIIGSKTLKLVESVVREINRLYPDIETEILDLKNYKIEMCDGRNLGDYGEDTQKAVEKIVNADFYLIGTPVFQSSITGALKNLLDLVPPDAFRYKAMGFVANGGTYQHYLVIENQLRPIAGYFRCYTAPSYVYAHQNHFNEDNEIIDEEVLRRITVLAEELASLNIALYLYRTNLALPSVGEAK